MRRFLAACIPLCALSLFGQPAKATPTALVMNGIDNTLSTADLGSGSVALGQHGFGGFPSEAIIRGGKLYVVVSGADVIEVLDSTTLNLLQTLSPGAGSNPFALDVDSAGTVYVSLFNTGELVRFNAAGTETGRVSVGRSPEDVLLLDGVCYVANTGFRSSDFGYDPGTVTALDPATLATLGTIPVGLNPQWLASWAGDLHVVCTGNFFSIFGQAHVVDGATHVPEDTLSLGGSPGKIVIDSGLAVTADYFGGLYSYDADTRTVIRDSGSALLVGGSGYSGLAFDGLGNLFFTLFDDDLLVRLRLIDETVTATYTTGDGPQCFALRDDTPVPVRLAAFSLEPTETGVRLAWTLADAHEAATVTVERRSGNALWSALTEVRATEHGEWIDSSAPPGEVVYRLSARLRTGEREVLGEERLTLGLPQLAVRPLATPARGAVQLAVRGVDRNASIRFLDVSGRSLLVRNGVGDGTLTLDVSSFAAGVYFVHLVDGRHSAITRVVVAH